MIKSKYLKNKKGNMTYTEFALIVFSIVAISLILFFSIRYISSTKESITLMQPEISYKFPAVFVHSFLMQEIEKNDTKNLGLDITQTYYVKDLIWFGEEKHLDLIKGKYRDKYLEYTSIKDSLQNSIHDDYKKFVGQDYYSESDLIQIKKETNLPDLGEAIKNKNYFFYLKTKGGEFVLVYFI